MNPPFSTDLFRLQYWQGQLLQSRDLSDPISYSALLQAWHNRALHNAYGVSRGLQASLSGAEVNVQPGLAYNAYGQELLLAEARTLDVPGEIPTAGLYLILGRPTLANDAALPPWDAGAGQVRLEWKPLNEIDHRLNVPLARCVVRSGSATLDAAFSAPPSHAAERTRCFFGATLSSATPWRLWNLPGYSIPLAKGKVADNRFLGIQVDVDTRPAGFTQLPCYFAWIEGSLYSPDLIRSLLHMQPGNIDQPIRQLQNYFLLMQFLSMRFGNIREPTPQGFTYRLWLPVLANWLDKVSRTNDFRNLILVLAQQGNLTLNWLGVEMNPIEGGL